jgi:predicted secreted hydrolase
MYPAHFAITDIQEQKLLSAETIRRAGVGMAGVDAGQGRIWNGPWSAELRGEAWVLRAADARMAMELVLEPQKPPVIQGRNGISQKSEGAGNASHYYSLTRLETKGELQIEGQSYPVSGWAWMDHEFSTSQLSPQQVGWDWVSLQMDDGTEWMFFQLRRHDGARDPHSAGTFVSSDGRVVHLAAADFRMLPLREWKSPRSGAVYPVEWRVQSAGLGLDIGISAAVSDQELDARQSTGLTYWEGSIEGRGRSGGRTVSGRGYLEMTGYAGPLPSALYSSQ